jgi:hypothetical protein
VSHKQNHRGPGPKDQRLFAPARQPVLHQALADLCWLLNRGYALRSAVDLVGNRYALVSRQRMAIMRCACSDRAVARRREHEVTPGALRGQVVWLDGYNVLTILEAAYAGGIILVGRDGCCRDILGVHRRYRKVEETFPVLALLGRLTTAWGVTGLRWCLDQPVSNSGRLKALLGEAAAAAGWNWEIELALNADRVLARSREIVASSDAAILDRCERWVNLARLAITIEIPQARLLDLSNLTKM